MHRWISAVGVTLLAVTLLTAFACGSGEDEKSTTSGAVSLEQDNYYFQPTKLTDEIGKSLQVALKNEGTAQHTFTIDALNIDQLLNPGEAKTVTVTPKSGGELAFYCRFHVTSNGMKGTITVSGGSAGASSTAKPSPSATKSTSGGGYGSGY